MAGKKLKIALAQIDTCLAGVGENLEKHLERIAEARKEGADLILFPELSLTGYSLKDAVFDVAMTPEDPRLKPLYEASKDNLSGRAA